MVKTTYIPPLSTLCQVAVVITTIFNFAPQLLLLVLFSASVLRCLSPSYLWFNMHRRGHVHRDIVWSLAKTTTAETREIKRQGKADTNAVRFAVTPCVCTKICNQPSYPPSRKTLERAPIWNVNWGDFEGRILTFKGTAKCSPFPL